jgi:hypothetical protein
MFYLNAIVVVDLKVTSCTSNEPRRILESSANKEDRKASSSHGGEHQPTRPACGSLSFNLEVVEQYEWCQSACAIIVRMLCRVTLPHVASPAIHVHSVTNTSYDRRRHSSLAGKHSTAMRISLLKFSACIMLHKVVRGSAREAFSTHASLRGSSNRPMPV